MSKVLGPIHFWLYNKIGRQEALTEALAERAKADGKIESTAPYAACLPPLEEAIDRENIHGWLQERIADAETRFAALVAGLWARDASYSDTLQKAAFAYGCRNALPADTDAPGAYRAFDDFFLSGMPCDRVNVVTEAHPNRVLWEVTKPIHAQYWASFSTGSAPHEQLILRVMEGMLQGTRLTVRRQDATHYAVEQR